MGRVVLNSNLAGDRRWLESEHRQQDGPTRRPLLPPNTDPSQPPSPDPPTLNNSSSEKRVLRSPPVLSSKQLCRRRRGHWPMGGLLAAFSPPIGEVRMLLLPLRAKEVPMRDVALNELYRRRVGRMQNHLVLSSGTYFGFSFVLSCFELVYVLDKGSDVNV